MTKSPEFETLNRVCLTYQEQERTKATSAHAKSHLLDVASIADLAAQARRFALRARLLLRVSSLMHDVQRLPTEDPKVEDEQLSAQVASSLMEGLDGSGIFPNTPDERRAVKFAIENHSQYPYWYKHTDTREDLPQTLEEQLWESLFVGDKMTQNGVWVIARRSAFVAGDRLQAGGDLQEYGFRPKSPTYHGDEESVVIYESALRLTFINPQDIYPQVFKPMTDPSYHVQREFVWGLCNMNGMGPEEIAEMLINRKRSDGKNIFEVRGISNYSDLERLIAIRGGISRQQIDNTNLDRTQSAREAVIYFSSRYKADLVETAQAWRPRGKNARRWQRGMQEYLNGNWYRIVEGKLHE